MATGMERSVLERKTVDELSAIATTLGGKPPARSKKADLVTMVLELAGVPEPAAEPARDPAPEPAASEATSEPSEAEAEPEPTPDPAPEADARDADPDPRPAPEPADRNERGDRGDRNDRNDRGEQAESGDPADRDGNRRPDAPERGGTPAGDGDDAEPGNRRRRRRNRDRDRDRPADEVVLAEPVPVSGVLDLRDEGYGFLRVNGYLPSRDDVYVSVKQVRQFGLRRGDEVAGASRPASRNERNPALLRIDTVNGGDPELARDRRRFEELTPLFPDERLRLERREDPANMTARIIDLIAPIGKGQRGLIVAPPKAGKTTVMKQIVRSIEVNHPEVHLIVLLVDERPEEVTDFTRWLQRGEVAASTFDRPSEEHTLVAELVVERAKRMVEERRDVVIVLDGITRLARAYNLATPPSGRVMTGGIDAAALYPPKRIFGAARNLEEGGSLTILATALVETGSRMDEHIFEEFKGTGNMELRLDRRAAERRLYPAIDVDASSTRHEELLFERHQLQSVWKLRRVLHGVAGESNPAAGLEMLIERLGSFRSNAEFLNEVTKTPAPGA